MAEKEIIKILEHAFLETRKYLMTEGYKDGQIVKYNPSGDISRMFDIKAEEILIGNIKKEFPNVGILSEEAGEIGTIKNNKVFVIDPVDGSFNFIKKIGGAGCSIALFENGRKDLRDVTFGFIGNYITGDIFYAKKGLGTFLNNEKIKCTDTTKITNAIVGIDFDYNNPADRSELFKIFTLPKRIRYIGSATIDVCNVARGAYDAYIDVRDDLTPENFCAAQLIIKEAGGIFVNKAGQEITDFLMIDRFSIIACSTIKLKDEILKALK